MVARGYKSGARVRPSSQSTVRGDSATVRGDSATVRADSSNPSTPGITAPNSQRPSPATTDPESTSNSLSAPNSIIPPELLGTTPQPIVPPAQPVTTPAQPVTTPPDKNPTTESLRQQVTKALYSSKKRQRKTPKAKDGEKEEEELSADEIALIRKLDRHIRWHCFLFFTNNVWQNIAKECYGDAFDIDSDQGQTIRMKIFDVVKGIKHKTLEHMEEHVKEVLNAPEHAAAKDLYTTRPLLLDFFAKLFTPGNFFAVWRYMKGYVEFEGSSDLGQYYMKSIYINLAIEMKLYLDKCAASPTGKNRDARERLLTFYNEVSTHKDFNDVEKSDFKEIQERYHNQHEVQAKDTGKTLKECFLSIGAPPPKKKQMVAAAPGTAATGATPSSAPGAAAHGTAPAGEAGVNPGA